MARRIPEGLVVSCQPVPGGPQDSVAFVVGFALAARDGGASALRIEGLANVEGVRKACDLPIIGIVKRPVEGTPVFITPTPEDIADLARAGADIVAFDATLRPRPASVAEMVATARRHGVLTMADCATIEDARAAVEAGIDIVGTTLSGYTGGPVPEEPDLAFVAAAAALGRPVMAEGRYRTWDQVRAAIEAGATSVVVGSALTRTEHATGWFVEAVRSARPRAASAPVLAADIGGTKISIALVDGPNVIETAQVASDHSAGPDRWLDAIAAAAEGWRGRFGSAAAAVTGRVAGGRWSALNRDILPIPDDYPLVAELERRLGVPASALNDAQAAAWGEHRFGAGRGKDIVFLTVSTGIGGGIVSDGKLVIGGRGLAGSLGQTLAENRDGAPRLEEVASGSAIARHAAAEGRTADAVAVFAATAAGSDWAEAIIEASAGALARALYSIQLAIDPATFVIGGGVGLADGYLDRVRRHLGRWPEALRPVVHAAELGAHAGLVGVADFSRQGPVSRGETRA